MSLLFFRAPKGSAPAFAHSDELIRAELFSVERLEQHGETLVLAHRVTGYPGRGRPMAPRMRDNGRVLLEAYRSIAGAIREERAITPTAEWLVDKFHVVEEQIREIRDDLPRGFYRQLPKLAEARWKGIRAFSGSRGPTSRIPTVTSIRRRSPGSPVAPRKSRLPMTASRIECGLYLADCATTGDSNK